MNLIRHVYHVRWSIFSSRRFEVFFIKGTTRMIWLSLGRLYRREEQKSEPGEYEGTEEETVSPDRERDRERKKRRKTASFSRLILGNLNGEREKRRRGRKKREKEHRRRDPSRFPPRPAKRVNERGETGMEGPRGWIIEPPGVRAAKANSRSLETVGKRS